jgi:peptidoglycan/xylan/chitin deacetylase (PgdA/CDA1 family)
VSRRPDPLALAACSLRLADPRAVALTFDDGPDETYTPRLLEILARADARATFFLVGRRVEQAPSLVREILDEGHAVGSHSQTHPEPWRTALRTVLRDYDDGKRTLERVVGRDVDLFRPPYGWLTWRSALGLRRRRLAPWTWSLDPEDWHPRATAESIAEATAAIGGGDVVLLHDGVEGPLAPEALDRAATLAAVPLILEQARARGLEPVRLSEG